MAVQLAKLQNEPQQRQSPLYKPTHANLGPREPGLTEQFGNMAKQQVMGDALNKGTSMAYEKGSEFYNKLTADPLTPMPSGGPLATPTATTTASPALPGSLQSAVTKAPIDAASMMSQTGTMAAPVGGPLASATQIPGSLGANAMAQGTGMQAITGGATTAGTGAATAAGTGAATGAAGAGAGAAGGAGAMAGMAAAAPYVAAGLAADELLGLGLREKVLGFEEGGPVGGKAKEEDTREGRHLYDTEEEYQEAVEANKIHGRGIHPIFQPGYFSGGGMMGLGPLALKKMEEEGIKSGGLLGMAMMSAGGPVEKVEYKSQGGDIYKLSYGGLIKGA